MTNKTIEDIRKFVEKTSHGGCELLSDVYIGGKYPLEIKCSCGNVFLRTYENMKRHEKELMCKECMNRKRSEKYRTPFEDVVKNINSTGCKYISGQYENGQSILVIRCRCGNIFKKRYAQFMKGQDRCPQCGNENVRNSKIKYTLEDVQEKISERGYILLEKEYLGAHKKMRCRCSKGHEFDLIFSQYLKGCSGCNKCAIISKSGVNHPNYSGGESKVIEALRNCVDSWRKGIIELYDYKCPISGEEKDLEVHHLRDFSQILDICSKKCGVPIHKKLKEYSNYDDFVLLKDTIIEYHNNKTGILISSKIHSDFHKEYGKENNTTEQFDEFLKENFDTCLEKVMRK